jgi:hypothetical protein
VALARVDGNGLVQEYRTYQGALQLDSLPRSRRMFDCRGSTSMMASVQYTLSMAADTSGRPGRNEPCRCGSGRKYKHCCLDKEEQEAAVTRAKAAAAAPAQSSADVTSKPARVPKHHTDQPWRATSSRGFVPRSRTPRKVGGS